MGLTIQERLETIHAGTNPTVICRVPSGWVVLCDMQYLSGYCVLLPDPAVPSLNDLSQEKRAEYLCDMATVGDALIEVIGAFRINYAILGNSEPVLHAHIIPRFMSEPEQYRKNVPWSYPNTVMESMPFDYERDKLLIERLKKAIQRHINS